MDSATIQTVERLSGNAGRRPTVQTFVQASPRDALDLLEQFGATVSVQRDQEIHGQGEEATSCYRILRGCVRMVKLMEDGRRQIGEFLMAGDLLGFDALETHDFAAEAVSDVVLRRYPRRMVDALAERNAPLARKLRDLTSISLRTAHARLVLLGRKTASERIATFLLEMAERLPHRHGRSSWPDDRDRVPHPGTASARRHRCHRARHSRDPRLRQPSADGVGAAALNVPLL